MTRHAVLDATIRTGLANLGVSWNEKGIADFRVFYDLSCPVQPVELHLPLTE